MGRQKTEGGRRMTQLSHFGMHRSIEPENVLAPSAWRLDNTTDIRPDEILIDAETIDCYNRFRKQKGLAVARVEQGTCRGCRISLSTAELQRVKGNKLIMCSSCGRILFID